MTHLIKKMQEAALSFSVMTEVPVTHFDLHGQILWEYSNNGKFCDYFDVYHHSQSVCTQNLRSSAKIAAQLGEPYIFLCRAGLTNIAFPVILQGKVTGCLIAGPFLMGGLKESIFTSIISINALGFDSYAKVMTALNGIKAFKPKDVSRLASLFGNSILGALTPNNDYLKINKQYHTLQKIGEDLQKCKKANKIIPYPHEMEDRLIEHVKSGNVKESLEALPIFLAKVSVIEAGDLSAIRTIMLSLCSALFRLAAEKTDLDQEETERYYSYMENVNQAEDLSELSLLASEFIGHAAYTFEYRTYAGSSPIVKRAIRCIHEGYRDKTSLRHIAQKLHISPPYLSMLFKQEMGVTITDYLHQVRIKESCKLLSETTIDLASIYIRCGFDDQSYFSKIFKKITGMTPKEYRRSRKAQ